MSYLQYRRFKNSMKNTRSDPVTLRIFSFFSSNSFHPLSINLRIRLHLNLRSIMSNYPYWEGAIGLSSRFFKINGKVSCPCVHYQLQLNALQSVLLTTTLVIGKISFYDPGSDIYMKTPSYTSLNKGG